MKRVTFIITLALLLLPKVASSQLISHTGVVPGTYDFWVYVPQERTARDTTKLPLVIFLHGKSLSGNNLERVRSYGPLEALKFGRQIDALILAPQAQASWSPSKVMKVLEWTENHYPVDTSRIYVFGMSMGGYGTIDFVGSYPDKIAAAIAMCGGGTIKDYSGLNKVPLWIIHGTSDSAVHHSESEKIVAAMKASGPADLLRFDLIPGASHSRLGRIFYMSEPYQWLFKHSLADSVRTVDRSVQITEEGMSQAYRNMPGRRNLKVISYKGGSATKKSAGQPEATVPVTEAGDSTYVIKKGDTLGSIARRHSTTVESLCEKNNLTRRSILRIGQRIKL
ncbi:MAG: LysM peptidoglycan-binding domain-containing protein [Bacteroidales bacterium]|nr:LysM peptidoglycan-binding domain-containing protein [Bacteroidales bacterium]